MISSQVGFPEVVLQDFMVIANTYEKGCNASLDPNSCFAVLARITTTSKCTAALIETQNSRLEQTSNSSDNARSGVNLTDPDRPLISKIEGFEEAVSEEILRRIKECIPCDFRLIFTGELSLMKIDKDMREALKKQYKELLQRMMSTLENISNTLFSNITDGAIDLCEFFNSFLDFICVPDIARILAMLQLQMSSFSFELGGALQFILGLVAPLIMPFIMELVDQVIKFIMMAVKPIECVIDALISQLSKLDYAVILKGIDNFDNISFGKQQSDTRTSTPTKVPPPFNVLKDQVPGAPIATDPLAKRGFEFNLLDNSLVSVKAERNKEQREVDNAAANIQKLNQQSSSIDLKDPQSVKGFQDQMKEAKSKYNEAVSDRDSTAFSRSISNLDKFKTGIKSMILSLVSSLKDAVIKINAFISSLLDELQKLMGNFVTGSNGFLDIISSKLATTQLINFCKAIWERKLSPLVKTDCSTEEVAIQVMQAAVGDNFTKIFQDENGNVRIVTDNGREQEALEQALAAFSKPDDQISRLDDTGERNRQKLKSLIGLTGNEVLDGSALRTINTLTTPKVQVFSCSSRISLDKVDQVNQWISELNQT